MKKTFQKQWICVKPIFFVRTLLPGFWPLVLMHIIPQTLIHQQFLFSMHVE